MDRCRLLLLGPPHIESDQQNTQITLRKAIALITYLAVEQREFSREYLSAILWPGLGQKGALANLRRTLSLLRLTFGDGCIVTEGDLVSLDRTSIRLDIDEFRELARHDASTTDYDRLEAASRLYRGSFLEGFNLGDCEVFDEWQDAVRERLRLEYDALLGTLSKGYLQSGRPMQALPIARRWLELDQLNEAAHRTLMEIHARAGRADLARKQYESCTRALAREGIEPDEVTRELHEAIVENRAEKSPVYAGDLPKRERAGGSRRRRRRIALIAAVVVVASAGVTASMLRRILIGSDFSIAGLEVVRNGDELSEVRIAVKNDGVSQQDVEYTIAFVSDDSIGPAREYVVYSDKIGLGRNAEVTVNVRRTTEIRQFVNGNDVRIPPGNYSVAAVVDSKGSIVEHSEFNNRLAIKDHFFYEGAAAVEVLEVEITYSGQDPLDDANPLKVFVGDLTQPGALDDWGQFEVTSEGTYYFPLDDVPHDDVDGSGYFLVIVYDAGDDIQYPHVMGPGDVAGLYKEVADNVVYGGFGVAGGTPMFPGGRYRISFDPPPLPAPDLYETDDANVFATTINYDDLPVRQQHSFHDEGSGDVDGDWYRIPVRNGDSITVETFSAGGLWESDTAIDFNDSQMNYLGSNRDKAPDDTYSRLTYVNETGVDQVFHFFIKPHNQFNLGHHRYGEYVVEFRE